MGHLTIYTFLVFICTSCQFNLKVADENNKFSVGRVNLTNFYMHNSTGLSSDKIDVYLDNKKVNLEVLDLSGVPIESGKHSLDIINKETQEPADHFDFEVERKDSKHMYLCPNPEKPNHYSLSTKKNKFCKDSKTDETK